MHHLQQLALEVAPMEGLTGHVFRNLHHKYFPGADAYYTPFLVVNQHHSFKRREKMDVAPEYQEGMSLISGEEAPHLIPQLMAKDAELFLWGCQYLADLGYEEVNLNASCPSSTVVSKQKGCGLLSDILFLERFLDAVFEGKERLHIPVSISIKTRLGMEEPEEMEDLATLFSHYPIARLIVHARVGKMAYRGRADHSAFARLMKQCEIPLSYNGDLESLDDIFSLLEELALTGEGARMGESPLCALMVGRGLFRNPALFRMARGGSAADAKELLDFSSALLEGYAAEMDGYGNALYRMKEFWSYLGTAFVESDAYRKAIRKSKSRAEFLQASQGLVENCLLREW